MSLLTRYVGEKCNDETNQREPIVSSDFYKIIQWISEFTKSVNEQEAVFRKEINADQLRATQTNIDAQCLASRPTSTITSLNENDLLSQQFSKASTLSVASLPPEEVIVKNYEALANAFYDMETSPSTYPLTSIDMDVIVKSVIVFRNADLVIIKFFHDHLDIHQTMDDPSVPIMFQRFLRDRASGGPERLMDLLRRLNISTEFVRDFFHYLLILFDMLISGKFQGTANIRALRATRTGSTSYNGQDAEEGVGKDKNHRKKDDQSQSHHNHRDDDDDADDDDDGEDSDEEDEEDDDEPNEYDKAYLAPDDSKSSIIHQDDGDYTPHSLSIDDDDEDDDDDESNDNDNTGTMKLSDNDTEDDDDSEVTVVHKKDEKKKKKHKSKGQEKSKTAKRDKKKHKET
jgi:hypothetical protein